MAYDGSIKIDTKVDTGGFVTGVDKMKTLATKGVAALTTTFAAVSGAVIAGGTAATHVGSEFESAMSKVSAISGATGNDLLALTNKAKEMGATTKFSASESASALQYMAMAGWQTSDMLEGIGGIMSLAAADGLDLATTSDIVTDALTAFGLKASDSSHFADVLAKASSSANTNVSMLGESFKYVAPLAGAMGYSAEDVSVALGLMANASVKGSMAGTSLKTALSNLASPTKQMAGIMDKYGISIADANGKALPLADVLKQLREKFGGLSEAEQSAAASTLFGKEAMSGMLAIINASDDDFNNLTNSINNADGAAKKMADTMQDNLQGQITILKSGLEGLGIEIYEGMSSPLKDAAIEAQNYVGRLTDAFKDGGLTGMIEEAGSIFGELAVKAAEAAPKMVEAAIGFLQSFVDGIANNSDKLADAAVNIIQTLINSCVKNAPKLISAAKTIVSALVNNLVKLLPSEVQKPVKEAITNIQKSFQSGGLRNAINTVKTIIQNLGKVIKNVAMVILPPLSKAVDFLAGKMKVLLPIVTAVYTAYKAYTIISTVTAALKASTAAVTAASLAHAAETGALSLKNIAIGVLNGQITLATALQYAWNLAMSMNPIGLVVAAVAALAAGIGVLALTMGDATNATRRLEEAQEKLDETNHAIGESFVEIGSKFSDFANEISGSTGILDNFNEEILISDEDKQALEDNMSAVQGEITKICKTAAEERRELTGGEIQRLEELFQKMHELAEQELAIEQAKQGVVTEAARDLSNAAGVSLEEYTERSKGIIKDAGETRDAVVEKAKEQYYEELALLDQKSKTQADYSAEQYQKDREAAKATYDAAIEEANKVAGDTLAVLQKGYYDRANVLKEGSDRLTLYNSQEEEENKSHAERMQEIESNHTAEMERIQNEGLSDNMLYVKQQEEQNRYEKEKKEEQARNLEKIEKLRNLKNKFLSDEQYRNQLAAFGNMEMLYETYTGKTGAHAEEIVKAFEEPMKDMPDEVKDKFKSSMDGAISGCEEKENSLFEKARSLASGFISTFKRMFDEHSPSKVFEKIFGYTIEGGELGAENEAKNLYKTAGKIGGTFTKRLKDSLSFDGLISRMREGVEAGKELLTDTLTSRVLHDVDLEIDKNNKKFTLNGDVYTKIDIDGREVAVATTPYMSEELAWNGGV